MNNANVRHYRFGKDCRNITRRERRFKRSDIIELDNLSGVQRIDLRTHIVRARHRRTFFIECDEGFIHGTMIAIIEDKDLGALSEHARHAQYKTICIGGSEGKLPVRKFEATLQFLTHPNHIFIR